MHYFKTLIKVSFLFVLLVLASVVIVNYWVVQSAKGKVYENIETLPHNKVGLLLGTSKKLSNGRVNLYYKYRIEAASKLFKAGKIDFILVSGDNSTRYYDEPTTIKKDLIAMGIPAEKIFLDYAGFRTLDSVVRSKLIFGQESITVISQQFHNERAIFIANRKKIKAIGFNAHDVGVNYGLKTKVREYFARVKMMMDLMVGKQPKFLGEQIKIK